MDRLVRALTVQVAALAIAWQAGGRVFTADTGEVLRGDSHDLMRTALRQGGRGVRGIGPAHWSSKGSATTGPPKVGTGRKVTGSYPYGYVGSGQSRGRDAAPRADEQAAVARIVEMRRAGEAYPGHRRHTRR